MLIMSSLSFFLVLASFLSLWGVNAGFPSKIYGVNLGSWYDVLDVCSSFPLMIISFKVGSRAMDASCRYGKEYMLVYVDVN
jgi:hypothetical protein